eukprot:1756764-Rhodomonas_salina.2
MKRFRWYKLVPECLKLSHGSAHIGGRRPAPGEHVPPHLRCYNLQKTLLLVCDGAGFVNKDHTPLSGGGATANTSRLHQGQESCMWHHVTAQMTTCADVGGAKSYGQPQPWSLSISEPRGWSVEAHLCVSHTVYLTRDTVCSSSRLEAVVA